MTSRKLSHKRTLTTMLLALTLTLSVSTMLVKKTTAQPSPHITISGFSFNPPSFIVNRGDTATWSNIDPVIYTLWFVRVSDGSTYFLSDPILPEEAWSHIFTELGDFQYYSFERLWIMGSLKVKLIGDLGGGIPPVFFAFDDKCEGKDLSLFLMCFRGTAPPEAMWLGDLGSGIPPVFFAYDGKVDGKDLYLFLICFKGGGP